MEFTGKLIGFSHDMVSGAMNITFTVNERKPILDNLAMIKDAEKLKITAVKYRKKRSLDANAYYWAILTKLSAEYKQDRTS